VRGKRVVRKVTDVKLYDTICNNNLWVQYKIRELKKYIKDSDLRLLLNECLDILRCMKVQGQHMENRMRDYISSIEKLGFERKRKNKS
jgi:D-mannonate dehydratase